MTMPETALVPVEGPNLPAIPTEGLRLVGEANNLAKRASSPRTIRNYTADWGMFTTFCRSIGVDPLPADPATVGAFIASQVENGFKPSTIERRLSGVSYFHRTNGFESPTLHPAVRLALQGAKNVLGTKRRQAKGLLPDEIRAMVDGLDLSTPMGIRDKALLLVHFYLGCRVSELTRLKVEHLVEVERGLEVTIAKSKTDQTGQGRVALLPRQLKPDYCPVKALQSWLKEANIKDGWLFRGFARDGETVLVGHLGDRQVFRIEKKHFESIGLDSTLYSTHSFRRSFISESAKRGATPLSISRQSGHRPNSPVLYGYIEIANAWDLNAGSDMSL